jgi:segregation and condensation protein B
MEISRIEAIIEAILFASGDSVPLDKICQALELDKKTVKLVINNMIMKYNQADRGMLLREIGNGYQLCTKPELKSYVSKIFETRQKQGLSQAAYETLAIIAYNEPVTKAKIEKIRGVNSDSSIMRLIERNLVEDAGRLDAPGRPMLYKTTEEFLRSFGLKSVKDLPQIQIGSDGSIDNINK